jgi:hypothetical protein
MFYLAFSVQVFADWEGCEIVELPELEAAFELLSTIHASSSASSSFPPSNSIGADLVPGVVGGSGKGGAGDGGVKEEGDEELAARLKLLDDELQSKILAMSRLHEEKKRLLRAAHVAGRGGR